MNETVLIWMAVAAGIGGLVAAGLALTGLASVLRATLGRRKKMVDSPGAADAFDKSVPGLPAPRLMVAGPSPRETELERKLKEVQDTQASLYHEKEQLQMKVAGLETDIQTLKRETDRVQGVLDRVKTANPYVVRYGEWYVEEQGRQQGGGHVSELWLLCHEHPEARSPVISLFRSEDCGDELERCKQVADVYEKAARLGIDAGRLVAMRTELGRIITGNRDYVLKWPEEGELLDEGTQEREENNGQGRIVKVIRPIVWDLTNGEVYDKGCVQTGP